MSFALHCSGKDSTGNPYEHTLEWHVGEAPLAILPLSEIQGISVDGHELEFLQTFTMPANLWKDWRFYNAKRVAQSRDRDCALVIYGMLVAHIAPTAWRDHMKDYENKITNAEG